MAGGFEIVELEGVLATLSGAGGAEAWTTDKTVG